MEAIVHQVNGGEKVGAGDVVGSEVVPFSAVELKLPAGNWVVFAKACITNVLSTPSLTMICRLVAGDAEDTTQITLNERFSNDMTLRIVGIALNIGVTLTNEGSVRLLCSPSIADAMAITNVVVSAIQIDKLTVTVVPSEHPLPTFPRDPGDQ